MLSKPFLSRRWWPHLACLAAGGLVLTHYLLGVTATVLKSPTFDEVAHLAGGCAYWRLNDYRLQPENGNLPQRWAALPVAASGRFRFPGFDDPAWSTSDVWTIGERFFYELGNDLDAMLFRGRAMSALLSAALCGVVFFWSKSLWGTPGALVSLTLCAFCPSLLAHGSLMTSDACVALFFPLSVWLIWGSLHRVTLLRTLGLAVSVPLLFLSKLSAVLVLPVTFLLLAISVWSGPPLRIDLPGWRRRVTSRAGKAVTAMAFVVLLGGLTATAIWGACGWRYRACSPDDPRPASFYKLESVELASRRAGLAGVAIHILNRHRLLPESYLYGAAFVLAHRARLAFLNGEYSTTGWRRFFPYCFLVKTPLPTLLFVAGTLAWFGWRTVTRRRAGPAHGSACCRFPGCRRPWYRTAPLWVLLAVLWGTLLSSKLNIGHRHLLPVYPLVYVLAGSAVCWLSASKLRIAAGATLLGWLAIDGIAAYPHYLAYFNPIVGRAQAYRHLVDSSLDWGQDLPLLKRWLDQHPLEPGQTAYLSYFGKGNPAYYGIQAEPLDVAERLQRGLPACGPGVYCISATDLQCVYQPEYRRWTPEYETAYRRLLQALPPPADATAGARGDESLGPQRAVFRQLCTVRLLAFLRQRDPDDQIGFSINVYQLDRGELDQALYGPPPAG